MLKGGASMVNGKAFVQALSLRVLSPSTQSTWQISSPELNRPGLELTGYYEHFAYERPQVIGNAEMGYLMGLSQTERREKLEKFFTYSIPCLVVCRSLTPPEEMLELAKKNDVPVLGSDESTTRFIVSAIMYLTRALAPHSTLHAVLVDVYGVGVLITGESGVGKSESALELIKRGHQLVADDVVDVCRVNDNRLVGESPEPIRHFMEIRGVGIIDIRAMYGISAVLMSKSIDMEIHLEPWVEKKEYDRLGLDEDFSTIMEVKIPKLVIPVKPGRNLAIIIEIAARNLSQKRLGYSAAQELDKRLNDMMHQAAEDA
jgi:HPr kinase/phosphorylase